MIRISDDEYNVDNKKIILSPLQVDLLNILKENGGLNRKGIMSFSKTPRTTTYDNLDKLKRYGFIITYKRPISGRGRPNTIWELI